MKRVATQLRAKRDEEDKALLVKAGETPGSDPAAGEQPAEAVVKVARPLIVFVLSLSTLALYLVLYLCVCNVCIIITAY